MAIDRSGMGSTNAAGPAQSSCDCYDIVFVHLLNDYSGSPKVLREAIGVGAAHGWRAKLYVSSAGDGYLADSGIATVRYWYQRARSRVATFLAYMLSQVLLFATLLRDPSIAHDAVVYVNTLLPFGALLYGRLTGRRVICHVHEISLTPRLLQRTLVGVARHCATLAVYVSDAHARALPIPQLPWRRVHNALEPRFLQTAAASKYEHLRGGRFGVLMLASLRDYKGVPELIELAKDLRDDPLIHFDLVANEDAQSLSRFVATHSVPANLIIHPRTTDTAAYYERASLVLNLSRVDAWVETFGLTVLEAMAFGIPVIAPPVGGPPELVADGVHGFLVDSRDRARLRETVRWLARDAATCLRVSKAARERAAQFSPGRFAEEVVRAVEGVRKGIP
jgi:glycosyltransferase involved in cell wall biosynthesis